MNDQQHAAADDRSGGNTRTGRVPTPLSNGRPARTAVVLGAGGTVGIAYHAGVAKALADAGVHPADADLVVGTSAG